MMGIFNMYLVLIIENLRRIKNEIFQKVVDYLESKALMNSFFEELKMS